jgi:hypothetical protein
MIIIQSKFLYWIKYSKYGLNHWEAMMQNYFLHEFKFRVRRLYRDYQ